MKKGIIDKLFQIIDVIGIEDTHRELNKVLRKNDSKNMYKPIVRFIAKHRFINANYIDIMKKNNHKKTNAMRVLSFIMSEVYDYSLSEIVVFYSKNGLIRGKSQVSRDITYMKSLNTGIKIDKKLKTVLSDTIKHLDLDY